MDVTVDDVVQVVKDGLDDSDTKYFGRMEYLFSSTLREMLELKYGLNNYKSGKAVIAAVAAGRLVKVGTGARQQVWLAENYEADQAVKSARALSWKKLCDDINEQGYEVVRSHDYGDPTIELPVSEVCRMLGIDNPLESK